MSRACAFLWLRRPDAYCWGVSLFWRHIVSETLLRLPEVACQVKLSRAAIYRRIRDGQFPRPRALGPGCVRWVQSEIDAWVEALPVSASATG